MDIHEYFKHIGVQPKKRDEVEIPHIPQDIRKNDELYYPMHYEKGIDILEHSLDYELNSQMMESVLEEILKQPQDTKIIEPGCGSGILGCYIALNTGFDYHGYDLSEEGIKKAKERAIQFGLDENMFSLGDVCDYLENRNNILVTGRFCINESNMSIRHDMLEELAKYSDTLCLIQGHHKNPQLAEKMYEIALQKHGYQFTILTQVQPSYATDAYTFAFRADKAN